MWRTAVPEDTATIERASGLVGLNLRTGREVFRATGRIAALDPQLIAGADQTAGSRWDASIAGTAGGPLAPADISRPGPRR